MDGGRRVWAPHPVHGFVLGTIMDLGNETLTVKPAGGGKPITATYDRVFPAVDEAVKAAADNCGLMYLNEATLLDNVRARYDKDLIYTYTANILLAVNPYHDLGQLYSSGQVQRYKGQSLGVLPPHIFAIADKAYRDMKVLKQSHSIVVSGESGAGKTESTKYIIRYLTDAWGTGAGSIEQRLNEANPLLEAFGNAKTVRNHNSSRFGKFVEVHYDEEARVVGGFVSHYLLEKSRVCKQSPEERSYHIFYRICAGASADTKHALGLTEPKDYRYLNGGGLKVDSPSDDMAEFRVVENCMSKLGIDAAERMKLYRVVAAVLHLGNISFEDSGDSKGGSVVASRSQTSLRGVSGLLGLQPDDLQESLTSRVMTTTKSGAKGTVYKIPLKKSEAAAACDALAKALYVRLFDHIVRRVNDGFAFEKSSYYIGVLDIAGFEYYQMNSYEQFCINYCNEKLQQFFNDRVLKQEQALYEQEGLNVDVVSFIDNRDCIELIEAKSTGIIDLLDEESKLPQSSDMHFCEVVHSKHKGHFRLAVPRQSKLTSHRDLRDGEGFLIRHFAGAVCYKTVGFIDKNNDALHESLEMLMLESQDAFVKNLFEQRSSSPPSTRKGQGSSKKLALVSIASKFRSQLVELLEKLRLTGASFVRCLKPNLRNAPHLFMGAEILSQLHCAGMVAVLNLMDDGYPSRTSYQMLHKMYQRHISHQFDARSFCDAMFHSIGMHESDYKFGTTMVFFRPGKFAEFDQVLQSDQTGVAVLATKTSKWLVRARWRRAQYAVLACIKLMRKIHYRGENRLLIQRSVRGYLTRKKHHPRFETMRKLHTLKTRLDTVTSSVERLTVNKQQITEQMAELRKSIDKECGKIKGAAFSPAMMEASYCDLSGQLEQLLSRVGDVERQQKLDESAVALRRMQEEMKQERLRRKEEEEKVQQEEEERKMKIEMEAKRRHEEEKQQRRRTEQQLKQQEEAAKKLQAQIDSEEQARRLAMIEQERRDGELALRLAQEDGAPQDFDVQSPQEAPQDQPDSRLARRSLRRSMVVSAKQQEKAAQKHDLSGWKYAELRDTINTSCDVELLESCREEFHRRLKVYHEWKMTNKRKTPGQQDDNEQQRVPDSVMEAARSASGESSAHAPADDAGEAPQRYFRVPFVRPASQPRDQPKGWWYAHFDGQWIARQIDMLPGKKPIVLVAGKDDMEMCELNLEETGLTMKKGAEILPRQFEDLWARHNGPSYERPANRRK